MDLKVELYQNHSRSQMLRIKAWVGDDQDRFDELTTLVLGQDPILSQRGSWAFSYCAEEHPELIKRWMNKLLKRIKHPAHDGIVRGILRAWKTVELPEKMHGEIVDECFRLLKDRNQAVAIRSFAMLVLGRLCNVYPELWIELKMIINEGLAYEKPAFISTGKQLLKKHIKLKVP